MCCLAGPIIAGHGPASPDICLCWLPVWLPRTSALAHVRIIVTAADQPSNGRVPGSPPCSRTCSRRTRADPICAATGGHLSHPRCAQNCPIRRCAPRSPARTRSRIEGVRSAHVHARASMIIRQGQLRRKHAGECCYLPPRGPDRLIHG